jgi:DNA polymerase III gamma/tau subunit
MPKEKTEELVHKYRPKKLEDVVGQDAAISMLQARLDKGGLPHAIILVGPPGVGKTSLARILAMRYLKCAPPWTLQELNIADLNNIETVRRINAEMDSSTLGGGDQRAWILDECQQMGKPAQQALLKPLEEPPSHVYFFLCTTDPDKLIKPIRSRCTKVRLVPVERKALLGLLRKVVKKEGLKVKEDMLDRIADQAEGSPREALVYLDAIKNLKKEDLQIQAIMAITEPAEAVELARLLMRPETKWADIKPVLKRLEGEEVEVIRKTVLGYAAAIAANGGLQARALSVYQNFCEEMIQSGKEPRVHLTFACLNVVGIQRGKQWPSKKR